MSGDPTHEKPQPRDVSTDATLAAESKDDSFGETVAAEPGDVSTDATLAAESRDDSFGETLAVPGVVAGSEDELAVTAEAQGRYVFPAGRAQSEIGRGGIGRVLVALDSHVGREIALKELLPSGVAGSTQGSGVTSPVAARFLREARVTGQLEHPNIVPVYELGRRPDDTLYYAMKLVRGRTLSKALRTSDGLGARLDLLSHYVDLCQAIAYAHSRGVIHRDIKTENVMLGEFGETVVLDWGLAKVRGQEDLRERELRREIKLYQETEASQTLAGATMGTPAYMSPEQARGDLEEVDEQSDVWSLGAVLYELLTGRPPHTGHNVQELLTKVSEERVTPVRERVPEVPAELAAVAEKALRRERAQRYASARELAREIEAFQSGARVSSYQYSSWELLKRFVARNKALSAAAALLLVVLAVSTVAIYGAYQRAEDARGGEVVARKRAEGAGQAERQARLLAQDRERDAHLNLAVAYQEKADRLLSAHNYTAARIFAAAALKHNPGNPRSPHHRVERPLADPAAARQGLVAAQSVLFTARMYQAFHFRRRFTAHKQNIWSVAYFPDGTRVASSSDDGTVRLFRVADGKPLGVLRGSPKSVYRIAVSPDGTRVAGACGDGTVRIWDPRTRQIVTTLAGHGRGVVGLAFSPDGKRLASGGMDRVARIWDLATRKEIHRLPHENNRVWAVAFSPDGRLLATTAWHGGPTRVHLWDASTGKPLAVMTGHFGPAWSLAWSPDSKEVASCGVDKTIRLWSVAEKRQTARLLHHQGDVTSVAYVRGSFMVSASVDRSVALWLRPTLTVIASHRAHRNHIWSLAVAPTGDRVVTAGWDGDLRLFDLRTSGRTRMFFSRDGTPSMRLRFGSKGRLLLSQVGAEVRIQDAQSGRVVGQLRGHAKAIEGMDVSQDGRWVATASRDGTARIWDLAARQVKAVLRGHGKRVNTAAFTPDGRLLATGGSDRKVRLWRVPSGQAAGVLAGSGHSIYQLAISADGKRLASTSSDRQIRLWSLPHGKPLPPLTGVPRDVEHIAFGPGQRLLVASMDQVLIWDTDTRRQVAALRGHGSEIGRLRVTPDRRYAVTTARDNRVFIWDLRTNRPVQHMQFDLLPLGVDMSADHGRFAVSMGVPIHVFPFTPALWRQDPRQLLTRAQKVADLRLNRFRLVPGK